MSLELLDPGNSADVNAVADLHAAFLPNSFVVRLGPRFLRKFFYVKLVRDGLVGCTICRADGKIVGFTSYTPYPQDFMAKGLRKWFFSLCWIMVLGLLERPSLLKHLLGAVRVMRERIRDSRADSPLRLGEGLSIATVPGYRDFVPPGGTSRLPVRLFEAKKDYFRRLGFDGFYVLVEPANAASNKFCTAMGCQMDLISQGGLPLHRYTYRFQQLPAADPVR